MAAGMFYQEAETCLKSESGFLLSPPLNPSPCDVWLLERSCPLRLGQIPLELCGSPDDASCWEIFLGCVLSVVQALFPAPPWTVPQPFFSGLSR